MISKKLFGIGAAFAIVHLLGVCLTAWNGSTALAEQAPWLWVFWIVIDLPWSFLLYQLTDWSPVIVHGLISIWWFFLPILIGKMVIRLRSVFRPKRATTP
jgi:hypothetical protein